MVRIPTSRIPTHHGKILLMELLEPMGITQRELSDAIKIPNQKINKIIHGRRSITPSTALGLAIFFSMTPGIWMNLQQARDLCLAKLNENEILSSIQHYFVSAT